MESVQQLWRLMAALMTSVALLTLISGCKDDSGEADNRTEQIDSPTEGIADEIKHLDDYTYTVSRIPLPNYIGEISNLAYFNGKVFFIAAQTENATADNDYKSSGTYAIYSAYLDGTGLAELRGYNPPVIKREDTGGAVWINAMTIDDDGNLWVSEGWNFYDFDLPANFNPGRDDPREYVETYDRGDVVRKLNPGGSEMHRIDLSEIKQQPEHNLPIDALAVDGSENIYLGYTDLYNQTAIALTHIYVLDSAGTVLVSHSDDGMYPEFVRLPDEIMAFSTALEDTRELKWERTLKKIDLSAKRIDSSTDFPPFVWRVYPDNKSTAFLAGNGEFDFFVSNDEGLTGYPQENSGTARLLDWQDINVIYTALEDIIALSSEQFLALSTRWDSPPLSSQKSAEIVVLTKMLRSDVPEKTILTMAIFGAGTEIGNYVAEFNSQNPSYSIEIKDYFPYVNTQENMSAALDRFRIDITTGDLPDILSLTGAEPDGLETSGLFEDIYPLIDADPDLSRDDFVQAALKATEIDGKLYKVFSCFQVTTMAGNPSVVGESMGWTVEEFEALLDAHPEADMPLGDRMGKTSALIGMISADIDKYVNLKAGTVHFDNSEFIKLLELADRLPDDYTKLGTDYMMEHEMAYPISQGRIVARYVTVQDFFAFLMYKDTFGGEIVFKGFPCSGRNGHQILASGSYGLSSKSLHKEAAWSFLRMFFDKDWQIDNTQADFRNTYLGYFPSNQAAFDFIVDKAVNTGEGSAGIKATQDDADMVIELINSVPEVTARIDQVLYDIISEEAEDFFYGTKSAADAARIIQSRAGIYIAERSG